MKTDPDRLGEVIERLKADGLIPPVKSVHVVGGGIVRVRVTGPVTPDLCARIATAMGSTRWTIE